MFANAVNGADGLLVDGHDDLWVVANQADEIVVIDPTGKVVAKLGDFGGASSTVRRSSCSSPRAFASWATTCSSRTSPSTCGSSSPSFTVADSDWCAQVSRYTVARIPARLRGPGGG